MPRSRWEALGRGAAVVADPASALRCSRAGRLLWGAYSAKPTRAWMSGDFLPNMDSSHTQTPRLRPSLAIPLWRACQSPPTGFSGPSFVTEWNEDSKRALGFELGGKRGSDDGKAVLVGFRDDPPLADGSLGVEPDRHGALRHVLKSLPAFPSPAPSISLGAHGAIFFSSPSLPLDVPRTPGIRQTETQPAVSRHPAAEIPGLSRGHPSRGHIRTASTRPGRASYA